MNANYLCDYVAVLQSNAFEMKILCVQREQVEKYLVTKSMFCHVVHMIFLLLVHFLIPMYGMDLKAIRSNQICINLREKNILLYGTLYVLAFGNIFYSKNTLKCILLTEHVALSISISSKNNFFLFSSLE